MHHKLTGYINEDTPEARRVLGELKNNSYNIFGRIRLDYNRPHYYRDLCTLMWRDVNIIHLYYDVEGDRGKKGGYHMHFLIQSLSPYSSIEKIKSHFSEEEQELWIEEWKEGIGFAKGYSVKYVGNEGIGFDQLCHGFYYRYEDHPLHDELFQVLTNRLQFSREDLSRLAGRSRAQFYRDKKKYDLTYYKGKVGVKSWYLLREAIRYLESIKVLVPSGKQPLERGGSFNDYTYSVSGDISNASQLFSKHNN